MFKKSAKGEKVKVDFSITLFYVRDIPKDCIGNEIYVELKRGSKADNHFSSKKISAKETTVKWEEKFKFHVSFVQNAKTGKIDEKKELSFTLKEDKDAKGKSKKESASVGKGVINLADFSEHGTIRTETLQIAFAKERKSKEKRNPSLMVKIETQWLKLNNKVLVKKSEGNANGESVKIGNDEFVLQQADDVTESNVDVSDAEEEDKEEFEMDEDTSNKKNELLSPAKDDSSKRNDLLSPSKDPSKPSRTSSADVRSPSPDVSGLQLEISDLKKDSERQQKKIQRLTEQLEEEKKKSANAAPSSSSPNSAELEDLQRDKVRLEKKIERLTKDNEDLKAKSTKENGTTASPPVDNKKQEQLEKEKKDLEKEKKELKYNLEVSINKEQSQNDEIKKLKKRN